MLYSNPVKLDYSTAADLPAEDGSRLVTWLMHALTIPCGAGVIASILTLDQNIGASTDARVFLPLLLTHLGGWVGATVGAILFAVSVKSKRRRTLFRIYVASMVINAIAFVLAGLQTGMG